MPEANDAFNSFTPQEKGAAPEKPVVKQSGPPIGDGQFAVPHVATHVGLVNTTQRLYTSWHDEAMLHSRENSLRMRNDPVIGPCLSMRAYPTALLTMHIEPDDDEDSDQVTFAKKLEKNLKRIPGFLWVNSWLLREGTFVGRAGVQVRYQWVPKRGKTWMLPTAFKMVSGDKLVFGWDERVGIRVNGMVTQNTVTTESGRAYMLSPQERQQLIVHSFEPEDADYYRPYMAGSINGVGLRGKLYWLWALKSRIWGLGIDFLTWFAQGITAYYFESGNNAHYNEVRQWVETQIGNSAILFPRMKDGGPGYKPIERFEASTASPAFIQQLITDYFDNLIRLAILHQSLTSTTASTGLGSGVAAAHQTTFDNLIKYDATGLQETYTRDLLGPLYAANAPGMPCGRWVFDLDNPNVQQLMDAAQVIYGMGGNIPERPLLEAAGLPEVKDGETILTQVQPQNPAAVGEAPQGVPMVSGDASGIQPATAPIKMSRRKFDDLCKLARLATPAGRKAFLLVMSGRVIAA